MAKGKYCVTHPDNESTGRCIHCHRPYCPECVLENEHGSFCSLECRARYGDFRKREKDLPRVRRPWIVRTLIKLAILLAVGYFLYAYFIRKDPAVRDAVKSAEKAVSR